MRNYKCPKCKATTIIYHGPDKCPLCEPEYVRSLDGAIRKLGTKKSTKVKK